MFKKRHFIQKLYFRNAHAFCVIRPLLNVSRFELLKFCEFWNLPIFPDLTNLHLGLKRNRLRLQSLPYLKVFFNLNLFSKIEQIQKIIDFENLYFQWIFYKLYPFYWTMGGHFPPHQVFKTLPKILKYRILHYLFIFLKKQISFLEIESILRTIKK